MKRAGAEVPDPDRRDQNAAIITRERRTMPVSARFDSASAQHYDLRVNAVRQTGSSKNVGPQRSVGAGGLYGSRGDCRICTLVPHAQARAVARALHGEHRLAVRRVRDLRAVPDRRLCGASVARRAMPAALPRYAGYVLAATVFGWATGGVLGGIIADYIGRKRTMVLTILAYSLTTGLSAIAWNWESFAALRFLVGVGIGSEWATGASIVSELWPDHARGKAGGLLQSGAGIGASLPPWSGW